ncbi:unnamed protein product [Oppiella nova]|uniref:Uncharacterized protein n=1 Tax=Oppiella nova TaxID=334625 RepID=A0A7R9QUD3_9ACAR|nr:unnamed protein product [Oppiella nova]CAG2174388.1 unnamed protein product [Oppiella nova]
MIVTPQKWQPLTVTATIETGLQFKCENEWNGCKELFSSEMLPAHLDKCQHGKCKACGIKATIETGLQFKCEYEWNGCKELFNSEMLPAHLDKCQHGKCKACGIKVSSQPDDHKCLGNLNIGKSTTKGDVPSTSQPVKDLTQNDADNYPGAGDVPSTSQQSISHHNVKDLTQNDADNYPDAYIGHKVPLLVSRVHRKLQNKILMRNTMYH